MKGEWRNVVLSESRNLLPTKVGRGLFLKFPIFQLPFTVTDRERKVESIRVRKRERESREVER